MSGYLMRRFALMLLTLFGMSILIFLVMRLVPGNIADILVDSAGIIDPKQKLKIEKELGLDQPLVIQYWQWISGLARGDLGYAYVSERPAIEEIAPRIPVTAKLAVLALVFSVLIGLPLGVISAVHRNTFLDYFLRIISLSGLSMPSFWLGLLVLMGFVQVLGWIPIYNRQPDTIWAEIGLLTIPALVVGFRSSALVMRLTRSSMLEVLKQDYIRTARSKGAIIGIEAAFLIGGLIVTETVFNIPGVARFLVEAIRSRDYPIVQNLVMFIALVVVTVNFLVDLAYTALDPRIRLES
jgi:peptide/nickel transport system permease protein